MKKRIMFLFTFVPIIIYICIMQLSLPVRQYLLVTILCVSAISFPNAKFSSETFKRIRRHLGNGMMLLAVFMLLISVFPTEGILSYYFMLPHATGKADAIVVLASGATPAGLPGYAGYQRVSHGIELLKKNRAPKLIISTGFSKVYGFKEYDWVASYTKFTEADTKKIDILKDESIVTTYMESQYLRKHYPNIKSILLVTSGAHIKRSQLTFQNAGFTVYPAPVHDVNNVAYAHENYIAGFHATMHEWIGLVYYRLRGRF